MIIKPEMKTALIIFFHHNSLPNSLKIAGIHTKPQADTLQITFFTSKDIFMTGFTGVSSPTKTQRERT